MKTSRFLPRPIAALALMAVLATAALAQDMGGPPPGGPGQGMRGGPGRGRPQALDHLPPAAMVIRRPEVRAELALTDEQSEKIDAIMQALPGGRRGGPGGGGPDGGPGGDMGGPPPDGQGGPGGPGGPPPDAQGRPGGEPGMRGPGDRQGREKAEAEAEAKINAILTPAQSRRLGEIQIQTMGLSAAMVPAVQTKLGLSADQKAQLKALLPARGQGDRGQGRPGGPPEGQGGPGGPPDQSGPDQGGPGGGGPGGGPDQGRPGGDGPRGQGGPGQGGPGQGGPGRGGPGRGGRNDARRKALETKIATILTDPQKSTLKALGGKPLPAPSENRSPEGP